MDKREPPGRAAPFFITENCQAPFRKGRLTVLLLEELEHTLRLLIGLREHRLRGLRQNVHFCVLHHHLGHILSLIHILTVKADGTLSFDQDVFNKATDASPSLMGSIAERVASGIKQDAQRGLDAPSASLVGSAAKQQNMFGSSAFSSSQMDSISMMSTYNRLGAYNMSNYYAVGMMMNMFV